MYRFVPLLLVCLTGCNIVSKLVSKQELSENYALMEGVRATTPEMIDGNLRTVGEAALPEGAEGAFGMSPTTEVIVTLPQKKVISRIVIHSKNLKEFDVWADKGNSDWVVLKEVRSVKSNLITLSGLRAHFPTDRIRIRVLGTTDDAELRRRERARGGFQAVGFGYSRAPGKIYEIELYGYKSAKETEMKQEIDEREQELDDLLK